MGFAQQIREILDQDSNGSSVPTYVLSGTAADPTHTRRRMQQRAIAAEMIQVALLYGKCEHYCHATTYTLLDKCLKNTPYQKFLDKLRGLRVIAQQCPNGLEVTSVYWAWDLR
ncbi:MAG TPA: DUF4258 domain-containing protein [Stenomitos sp.]